MAACARACTHLSARTCVQGRLYARLSAHDQICTLCAPAQALASTEESDSFWGQAALLPSGFTSHTSHSHEMAHSPAAQQCPAVCPCAPRSRDVCARSEGFFCCCLLFFLVLLATCLWPRERGERFGFDRFSAMLELELWQQQDPCTETLQISLISGKRINNV